MFTNMAMMIVIHIMIIMITIRIMVATCFRPLGEHSKTCLKSLFFFYLFNEMSKFLNMGLNLNEVVNAVSWGAAKSINKVSLGNLSIGSVADITILNLQEGDFGFIDTKNKKMKGSKKLECEMTIKGGEIVYDLNGLASNDWRKK